MNTKTPNKAKKSSVTRKQKPDVPVKALDGEAAERIAKRMARAGLCSRREAEKWIAEGRVVLNGKTLTTPAVTVTGRDRIEVDGKPVGVRERTRLWLFNKPSGTVTTNKDPEGRKTIFEGLPDSLPRLMSVGRLDINTEGLLLMTNDGGLARVLELPETQWLRRYRVRVHGKVDEAKLKSLADGIAVDGILYGSIEAELEHVQGSNAWLSVGLREGKNREIKNVLGALGLEVTRLIRISFGPFQLGDLPTGLIREVRSRTLRDQLGERLVREAKADFEGPIVNQAPDVSRSTKQAVEQEKQKKKAMRKLKRGVAREDVLDRISTSKPASRSKSGDNDKKGKRVMKGKPSNFKTGKPKPSGKPAPSGKRGKK